MRNAKQGNDLKNKLLPYNFCQYGSKMEQLKMIYMYSKTKEKDILFQA